MKGTILPPDAEPFEAQVRVLDKQPHPNPREPFATDVYRGSAKVASATLHLISRPPAGQEPTTWYVMP